ncbi:MAG: gamma carbonic anhydrase family protein [Magnetovibrionaceae bacterium]
MPDPKALGANNMAAPGGVIMPFEGKAPVIDPTAFIAPTAAIIGDVEVGPESGIWFHCVLRGDMNEIRIGARTNIQDGTVIHVDSKTYGTFIGDDVTVGHMALIHACTIESGGFVGMHATVMDGAVIESGAMVAAGALVAPGKRVPAGELWGGTPARYLRETRDTDKAMMDRIAPGYVALAKRYQSTD